MNKTVTNWFVASFLAACLWMGIFHVHAEPVFDADHQAQCTICHKKGEISSQAVESSSHKPIIIAEYVFQIEPNVQRSYIWSLHDSRAPPLFS